MPPSPPPPPRKVLTARVTHALPEEASLQDTERQFASVLPKARFHGGVHREVKIGGTLALNLCGHQACHVPWAFYNGCKKCQNYADKTIKTVVSSARAPVYRSDSNCVWRESHDPAHKEIDESLTLEGCRALCEEAEETHGTACGYWSWYEYPTAGFFDVRNPPPPHFEAWPSRMHKMCYLHGDSGTCGDFEAVRFDGVTGANADGGGATWRVAGHGPAASTGTRPCFHDASDELKQLCANNGPHYDFLAGRAFDEAMEPCVAAAKPRPIAVPSSHQHFPLQVRRDRPHICGDGRHPTRRRT